MYLPRLAEICAASLSREEASSTPPYEAAVISIFTDVAEILARLRLAGTEKETAFSLCTDIINLALNGLVIAVPDSGQPALRSAYATVAKAFASDLADLNERTGT